MKSECQTFDTFNISNLVDGGIKLYERSELPMIEFKKGGKKYKVTNLRYLNEFAVSTFIDILKTVCNVPDVDSASYNVTELQDDQISLLFEIVSGISCGRKVRGHDSWIRFLVSGTRTKYTEDKKKILTFELIKDNAEIIYNYAQKQNGVVDFYDLVVELIEENEKRMFESL